MEPLTFILGVANSVLSTVIQELITGQRKAARKTEIEKEVSNQLMKRFETVEQELKNLQELKRKIMDEIELLAERDPTLQLSPNEIQLKKPINKPLSGDTDNFMKREVSSGLNELHKLIAQRQEELRLITKPDDSEPSETSLNKPIGQEEASIVWKPVSHLSREIPRWEREIIEMEDRIRRRRSGEDISDE